MQFYPNKRNHQQTSIPATLGEDNNLPLEGKKAFQKVLELTQPVNGSNEIWLKLGSAIFVTGEITANGDFPIYSTYKTGETPDTRKIGRQLGSAYDYIRQWSEGNDGGVFYIPTQPQGHAGKSAIALSDDIAAELDDGTANEQWDKISEFVAVSGLEPTFIAHSGSRSYHPHWKGNQHFPIEQTIYLRRLLCIALESDPAVARSHQPMRMPGFYRREKGNEQKLFYYSESRYSYDDFIAGFKRFFEAKGLPWLDDISEERWRQYCRKRQDKDPEGAIAVLRKSEQEIKPPRPNRDINIKPSSTGETIPLERCLTRDDQELINNGACSERNNQGLKLAKNLIATAERLAQLGHHYDRDPYDCFIDYCQRCSDGGGWSQREWDLIWRSAQSGNPTPSLPDEALEKRISYYQWEKAGFPLAKEEADRELLRKAKEDGEGELIDAEQWSKKKLERLFDEFLGKQFTRAQRLIAREKVEAEKETPQVVEPVATANFTPNYQPGNLLNNIEQENKKPLAIYRANQEDLVTSEALTKNRVTIKQDEAGSGKTNHAANNLKPSTLFGWNADGTPAGEILFLFQSPENPPIDLPTDWVRLPTINEHNCSRPGLHRYLNQEGVVANGDKNPACETCPFLQHCKAFGFKSQMQEAMGSSMKYGHVNGVPDQGKQGKLLLVIDELGSVPFTQEIKVDFQEWERFFAALEYDNETWLLEQLQPVREFIKARLAGFVEEIPEHGLDISALQQELTDPQKPAHEIEEVLWSIECKEQEWRERDRASVDSNTEPDDLDVRPQWFSRLMGMLHNEVDGVARLFNKELKLTVRNQRTQDLLENADSILVLDATATAEDVALKTGIDISQIQEIKKVPTATPNFNVVQLTGARLKTAKRREAGRVRKEAIKREIKKKHGDNIGGIDFKAHAGEDELKHHCSGADGAIGSNQFQHKNAIVSFGDPYPNLGAAKDEYEAITGCRVSDDCFNGDDQKLLEASPNFYQYFHRKVKDNFIQMAGRLRANRRPHQPLTYYAVTDYDIGFLAEEIGITVERVPIHRKFPECDELKTPRQKHIENIKQFLVTVVDTGDEILSLKQKDVAFAVDIKPSFLSRMVGGWRNFLNKINSCIGNLNPEVNFESELENFLYTLLDDPLEKQAEQVIQAIQQYGFRELANQFSQLSELMRCWFTAVLGFIVKRDRAWLDQIRQFWVDELGLSYAELGINPPPT